MRAHPVRGREMTRSTVVVEELPAMRGIRTRMADGLVIEQTTGVMPTQR